MGRFGEMLLLLPVLQSTASEVIKSFVKVCDANKEENIETDQLLQEFFLRGQ